MKIILLFLTLILLTACNPNDAGIFEQNRIKLYGYENKEDCSSDKCLFDKSSQILLLINSNNQTITYKQADTFTIDKKDFHVTSYGYLKDCKIISAENFQCNELSSDDGLVTVNKGSHDWKTNAFTPNKNEFTKFTFIGSSTLIHHIVNVVPMKNNHVEMLDKYSYVIFIITFLAVMGLFIT